MKEQMFFGSVALVFTSLLLLVRGLFLSRLRRGRGRSYEVKLEDDGGDSSEDNSKDHKSTGLSLVSPELLAFTASTEDWPPEIVVSSEAFHPNVKASSK